MHRPGQPSAVLLFILTVGNCLVNSPFAVYLALYAKSLGFTTVQWTLLNTAAALLASVSLLGLPRLLHRGGARVIMQASFLLLAGCFLAISTGTRAGVTAGALCFSFLASANSMCILTELQMGSRMLGKTNSAYTVIVGSVSIVAPLIAATVVPHSGYAALWYGCMGVMIAQAGLCFLVPRHGGAPEQGQEQVHAGERPPDRGFGLLLRSGFAWLLLGTAVAEPFSFQMCNLYASLRLSGMGLSDAAIGYVASAGWAAYLVSSTLSWFLLDRLDIRMSLAVFLTCAALSCAGFGLAGSAVPAVVCLLFMQLFYGWLHPAKNVRYARIATPRTLPSVFSLSISVQSFTCTGLGAAAAALVGTLGMQPLIAAGGLVAAAGGLATLGAPVHAPPTDHGDPAGA